ncbi:MAG: IS110 family transposase [Arachnia sp.]
MTHPPTDSHYWVGIDTHSQFHQIVVLDDHGHHVADYKTPTDPDAITRAVAWITSYAPTQAGIEGTNSYGAQITRQLLNTGIDVKEVSAPNKVTRRRQGKSDLIDAIAAADAVRTGQRVSPVKNLTILPRLRVMYTFRASAVTARTQIANQIHAAARALQVPITGSLTRRKVTTLLTHPALARAATRRLSLDDEARSYDRDILAWLRQWAPQLLAHYGVGPISAARLVLTAGGNPERLSNDAAFARLTGAAPIPCSSGKHQNNWRLDRGGDRAANAALHMIAFHRKNNPSDERTQAYIKKRTALGNDTKKILRLLKRAIIRELLPDLRTITTTLTTT